jgi:predicted small integral membrane protein
MSDNLTLGIVAGLAFAAIVLLLVNIVVAKVSSPKPPVPTYPLRVTRSQRLWTLVLLAAKFVARKCEVWIPVIYQFVRDCVSTILVALRKRLPSRRSPATQTIAPPFPAERVWRIARCHRSMHASGHLLFVSDYPDGKSRAVLRPRTRISERVDLGELTTGPASDLEFLRLAKAYRNP